MKKRVLLFCTVFLFCMAAGCGKNEPGDGQTKEDQVKQDQTMEETGESQVNGNQAGTDIQEDPETEALLINALQAVKDTLGEDYWPDAEVTADMLTDLFGIAPDLYETFIGETPMISVNVDTILIIKARENTLDDLEEAVNRYRESIVGNTMQYPMNIGKVQASRIETFGQYVCFVQLGGDTGAEEEIGDEAVAQKCLNDNEEALEVIGNVLEQDS